MSDEAAARGLWGQTLKDVELLVEDHKKDNQNGYFGGITKRHLKHGKTMDKCSNPACMENVSDSRWRYHCFRCGEVFCKKCVGNKMRLNNLAHPDPQGYEYNVCERCFSGAPQEIGRFRNWMLTYAHLRSNKGQKSSRSGAEPEKALDVELKERYNVDASDKDVNGEAANTEFCLEKECGRLRKGFTDSLTGNYLTRMCSHLPSACYVPEWQKPSSVKKFQRSLSCCDCESKFSFVKRRYDCSICGQSVCADCSCTDLLVYIPDEKKDSVEEPELTIINIVGCPASEPDVCVYLRICNSCKIQLRTQQVNQYHDQRLQEALNESWGSVVEVAETSMKAKLRIESYLPHYRSLVESLEQVLHIPKSGEKNQSDIQLVAKSQEDLSDYFTQLVVTIQGLKRMAPESKGQTMVLRNLTVAMCRAYHEFMLEYRDLKSRLENVTPLNILHCIQELVEKNTINGAYLSTRQLAYEMIHLCGKHKISAAIPEQVVLVEKVMYGELKTCVLRANENWEVHEAVITRLLEIQLKEHRFIRPSRRRITHGGPTYVYIFILERADAIVQRILMQLSVKCSDRSFSKSKRKLEELNQFLAESYMQAMETAEQLQNVAVDAEGQHTGAR